MTKTIKGSVSVYVLLCMGVLVTASVGVSALAVGSLTRVRVDRNTVSAQQAAFATLDHAIGTAWVGLEAANGSFTEGEHDYSDLVGDFAPGVEAIGNVEPLADNRYAWFTGTATLNGTTRSVRSFIASKNVGIWNNAVFAGSGASGQAINGNVDIRGSVHILGEGEAYTDLNGNGRRDAAEAFTDVNGNGVWNAGEPYADANGDGAYTVAEPYNDTNLNGFYDPPLTQTDLNSSFSGAAQIANNYSGMDAFLEGFAPAPPIIGGKETLEAEVRVKHGMIGINGSANIGETSDPDGGTSKGKVDGSYVNDGYTGNQGATSVFSDNGTSNTYDLGNFPIKMPLITGIGADPYKAADGSTWATHKDYLDSRSMVVALPALSELTPAFSFGPDANGNKISFTPKSGGTPAKLTVNGLVKINGNFQLGLPKENIRYDGNGTIYANGNMNIDANFLPVTGKKFPTGARMGLIAKQNMSIAFGAGSAQLQLAGAFYAQGVIRSAKQNQILGTFVANYYDLGTNVPKIYQVPSLVNNMPPAMPGDRKYFAIKVRSFRDRSPAPSHVAVEADGPSTGGTTGGTSGGQPPVIY